MRLSSADGGALSLERVQGQELAVVQFDSKWCVYVIRPLRFLSFCQMAGRVAHILEMQLNSNGQEPFDVRSAWIPFLFSPGENFRKTSSPPCPKPIAFCIWSAYPGNINSSVTILPALALALLPTRCSKLSGSALKVLREFVSVCSHG